MLCAVHSYPGANRDLQNHWPFFRRAFDQLIVVGTIGGGTWCPPDASYVEIGANKHVAGDHLPRRLVDTAAHLLTIPRWSQACITEYDVVFFKPFPPLAPGYHGHLAGGQLPGCLSTFFLHFPHVADRATWERFVQGGRELLAQGITEIGSPDTFAALVIERYGLTYQRNTFKSYSRNTIHHSFGPGQPDFIPEARQAYRDGIVCAHGIKTSQTYRTDSMTVLREIMRHD